VPIGLPSVFQTIPIGHQFLQSSDKAGNGRTVRHIMVKHDGQSDIFTDRNLIVDDARSFDDSSDGNE
jgi:hypothetical protein